MSRRTFTKEFKEAVIKQLRRGVPARKVARACRLDPAMVRRWEKESDKFGAMAFGGYGKSRHFRPEPKSRAIVLHVSQDEFNALKFAAAAAGFQSLAEFARFRMFHGIGGPPKGQFETVLEELEVVARKLTQRLAASPELVVRNRTVMHL